MKGRIYKIWNDVNNKVYIGKTLDTIENRFNLHKKDSIRKRMEKRPLYNAMNKYGTESFHIELIEECELEDLSLREIYWIEQYDSYKKGYNATRGGDGKVLYDYQLIAELYQQGLNGTQISQKLKCDERVVRNALRNAGLDTYQNMIAQYGNAVGMYDKETDVLLQTFPSQIDAGRWLQKNNKTVEKRAESISARIGQVCNGKRKTAYGYKWKRL